MLDGPPWPRHRGEGGMGTALLCVGKDGTVTRDNGQHFWSNWRTGVPESQGDGLATNLAPCHLLYWFKKAPVLWDESVPGRSDHFCITLDKFLGCWSPNNLRKTGSWGGGEEYRIWLSSPEAIQQRAQGSWWLWAYGRLSARVTFPAWGTGCGEMFP